MKKILILDDHPMILSALSALLSDKYPNIKVLTAKTSKLAFDILHDSIQSDSQISEFLVIADIELKNDSIDGIEFCQLVRQQYPGFKILVYTNHDKFWVIRQLCRDGINAIVTKNESGEEILKAIEAIKSNTVYYSTEISKLMAVYIGGKKQPNASEFEIKLTSREKQILPYIAQGLTSDEIAKELFISSETVITHRKNLLTKINAKNTAELISKAIEMGFLG